MTAMGAYLRGLRRQIVHIKKELQEVEAQKRALENKKENPFFQRSQHIKKKHAKIADLLQKQKEKKRRNKKNDKNRSIGKKNHPT
ncbi:MAG: hypothetical protein H6925_04145 [Holosporaceae bacterium]|nr:MAG: hypothetical protein H6925_04145 [Holosporaceae bacterium]